ncbi:hypothetical protein AB4140_13025 [Shewanella sp. 10N.286.51.B2]|uniref:hypothetical protein n=1 Tax=unclassified Shewanella TaxID=196818 RepID=UPI0013001461|nr:MULTISPECIES: hypothetical protein [unclassified Shewanella]MDO6640477.1 hypothetical protein [Shewanella sp. 5_MG-2023]MDO6777278.1 hypothetical protein [Shewanella sp. 3_MG-2023]
MFAQIFIVFVGLASLILGIQDGDYLWAFCGLIMFTASVVTLYYLKTGKVFGDDKNNQ